MLRRLAALASSVAALIAARATACTAIVGLVPAIAAAAPDAVDDYVRAQLATRTLPGVSLAVVKGGRIVKAAGYGVANLELDVAASEHTVYEIGSISKQFAANAVLLLVEAGKVGLDDPLARYIDHTPPAWAPITVRHVLAHTSGLADFDTGNIGFSYRREYTPSEFVELLGRQPLQFAPGERWNYTNAFPLLGMVVERASGLAYTEFVRRHIFVPLGLDSARFKINGDVVPHRADGYRVENGDYRHGETLRPAVIAANGGIMMSVVDFAKWDIAVTGGRLLRPASLEAMTTPARLNDGRTVSHGLGWFMDRFNGHTFGAHWGTTVTGHSAVIRRYVNDGVTVIVMGNVDDGGLAVDTMSKRIADMYVPGVDIHGLGPLPDPDAAGTRTRRAALTSVGAGVEHAAAPGLAGRLPAPVRARIAAALDGATLEYLGSETLGSGHFNLDPSVASLVRYRTRRDATGGGADPGGTPRYLTLRLTSAGTIAGIQVED